MSPLECDHTAAKTRSHLSIHILNRDLLQFGHSSLSTKLRLDSCHLRPKDLQPKLVSAEEPSATLLSTASSELPADSEFFTLTSTQGSTALLGQPPLSPQTRSDVSRRSSRSESGGSDAGIPEKYFTPSASASSSAASSPDRASPARDREQRPPRRSSEYRA